MITLFGKKTSCLAAGFILILLLVLPVSVQSAEEDGQVVKRLAVISFQALLPEGGSTIAVCPVCSGGYSSGKIEKGAEKTVEEGFIDKLRDFKEMQIIPTDKVAAVYNRVSAEELKKPLLAVLKKVGAELQADVIAVGYIYRYTERVGYDFSAERPASVAFEIHLLNVKDGSTIWHGVFDKTQKSLMENVYQAPSFFKGGGKWLTASQLAKQGIDEIFKTFPSFEH
jgi:hypothetical protein